jgi:hypothetical protein
MEPLMTSTRRLVSLVVASAVCWLPMAAEAALLAYDGFDYAPVGSDLSGKNGGFGFSTPWRPGGFNASINTNYDVQSDSLSFGELVTNGHRVRTNAVTAIAGLTRDLLAPLGVPGTTRYLSFLLRPEGQLHGGAFNGFFGLVLEQPSEPELFVGKPGGGAIDRYVLEDRGGGLQVASSNVTVVGQTVFLVLRAQFNAGNDLFTLYINPVPGGSEPAAGVVKNNSNMSTVAGLTLYSTGAFSIDELRLGETFADVTPAIPEPASALLALCAALSVIGARRRGS